MPTPNNTINLGPTRNVQFRAVQIEKVPPQIQQPLRMRLVINKVAGLPALTVWQDQDPLLMIYTADSGRVWGCFVFWCPFADGKREPFTGAMRDPDAARLLRRLLAGLDFAAARKARQAGAL